ncbi:MAG: sugar transferase [Fimbriimonadaceae bacterium]
MYRCTGKRLLDLLLASLCAVIFAPVMAVVWLVSTRKMGYPVLFFQERPGKNGETFRMVKFRTMTDERGEDGELLPEDKRLTSYGRWLRTTSLDELPNLLNVIKGEMSLVGPRPLAVRYLSLYSPEQARRHEVKPGVTGWSQVNGRNAIDWETKLALDVWYVDNVSFALDVKILFLTLAKVIKRSGISAEGHATMPEFKGPKK